MLGELVINRKSGKPVSNQIAQFLKTKIVDRELLPGQKLPTTQELMVEFGVGTHTICQAMSCLEKDGFVESTRRLGTFVSSKFEIQAEPVKHSIYRIGVLGLVQQAGKEDRFRSETAEGIIRECDRLKACAITLPSAVAFMSKEEALAELQRLECDGLIWLSKVPSDKELIPFLIENGIYTISSRRFRYNDGRPCIESDYDGAGFDVGRYFCDSNCDGVTMFSHFDINCDMIEAELKGYPMGLKYGIARAFEMESVSADIEVYVNKEESYDTSTAIYDKIVNLSTSTGIVFTNGYQLLKLIYDFGDKAKSILENRKLVVISNKTINIMLEPFVSNLDLMVLVDPYEEAGKLMVGKLMGMIDGYFNESSTTLVTIKFECFSDLKTRS